jgi:hypothetical protein
MLASQGALDENHLAIDPRYAAPFVVQRFDDDGVHGGGEKALIIIAA